VHGVEGLGLLGRQLDATLGDDAQAGVLDHGVDGLPVRLRRVASGLMIEKVRSVMTDDFLGGRLKVAGL
jgi:hypothetical protein